MSNLVPRYYDGSPQITIQLTPEIKEWVDVRGGRRFIRQAIMLEYNKKQQIRRDFIVDFGRDVKFVKVNVRLSPPVHEFALRMGGSQYVRDLLYRHMIVDRRAQKEKERLQST